jgi:calcium/calmodulin-dependent protein kinase I
MKEGLSAGDERLLRREVEILRSIDSEYVVKCVDYMEDDINIYVVLEIMAGGELLNRIVKKKVYNEAEARDTVRALLRAMRDCHALRIVHRDLKPENLLLLDDSENCRIKVADFGFATRAESDHCLDVQCGSPNYAAPELLAGRLYGRPADMWSVGVIVFILLGGYPPFYDTVQKELFRKIKAGDYHFHEQFWMGVSDDAKDLIKRFLVVNPDDRLTAADALEHPWLMKADTDLAGNSLNDQLMQLRKFNAKRKFRTAVKAVSSCATHVATHVEITTCADFPPRLMLCYNLMLI